MHTAATPLRRRRRRRPDREVNVTDTAVGSAIRDHRQQRELLLEELAGSTGIDIKVLSRIERGERPCRVSELAVIADALDISGSELLQRAQAVHAPVPPQ